MFYYFDEAPLSEWNLIHIIIFYIFGKYKFLEKITKCQLTYFNILTLGEAYAKVNSFDEAEHWYREALKVKPDHIPAHLTMAKMHQKKVSF